jgi:hypothetical protein
MAKTPSRIIAGKKTVAEFCSHELAKQGASVLLCARRAKVVRKGRPYCTQHDPERNQAKTVKAWAVVDKNGVVLAVRFVRAHAEAERYRLMDALSSLGPFRVIPCTITTKGSK